MLAVSGLFLERDDEAKEVVAPSRAVLRPSVGLFRCMGSMCPSFSSVLPCFLLLLSFLALLTYTHYFLSVSSSLFPLLCPRACFNPPA